MKIAYFLDIAKGLGGAGNLLLQQAVLMSELHDVVVVVPADTNGMPNEEYIKRCCTNRVRYVTISYNTANSFKNVDFSDAIKRSAEIEKFAVDEKIVFFHSVQLNIAVEYVARKLKIPHLMNIYSIDPAEFILCRHDIYPGYHLCDSQIYADVWQQNLNIRSRCIRPVAPLGNIKRKRKHYEKKIKIVVVGNIYPYKRHLTAIRAFNKCRRCYRNVELHILGTMSGSYAEECMQYATNNGLDSVVFFHGFVSDVGPYLDSSDCILCASIRESFPMSLVEALTYGLTIISTPVAGVPEVFVDKKNAFISKDFSEEAIADSIADCLKYCENGMIRKIDENAAKTWKAYFERNYIKELLNQYYEEIMSQEKQKDIAIFHILEQEISGLEKYIQVSTGVAGNTELYLAHSLYYLTVREKLSSGIAYIWGAGKNGKKTYKILKCLCPSLKIEAFVDRSKEGFIERIPIIKPEQLPVNIEYFYSISFNNGASWAVEFLESKGLKLNEQIWLLP